MANKRSVIMKTSDRLLVEQAWSLRTNLNRRIETERLRRSESVMPTVKIERLNSIQETAYSRYIRRLKKFWA